MKFVGRVVGTLHSGDGFAGSMLKWDTLHNACKSELHLYFFFRTLAKLTFDEMETKNLSSNNANKHLLVSTMRSRYDSIAEQCN